MGKQQEIDELRKMIQDLSERLNRHESRYRLHVHAHGHNLVHHTSRIVYEHPLFPGADAIVSDPLDFVEPDPPPTTTKRSKKFGTWPRNLPTLEPLPQLESLPQEEDDGQA